MPQDTPDRPDCGIMAEIMDGLGCGIAHFDADLKLTYGNAGFRAMYPPLEPLLYPGMTWSVFLHEAVLRGVMPEPVCKRLDAIEAGLAGDPAQLPAVNMPGPGGRAYGLHIRPTSDSGFALTQSEISDSVNEASNLREAEALLRNVLEACPVNLTMSLVSNGQVIYRSPAATELLGTTKSSFSHFADRGECADFITHLLPDGSVDNMRVTCLRPDGSRFPASISARMIDYRGEDVVVANIEDLTRELDVQAELDRQKAQLFQAEKLSALGELLASVSHELNNPLSIVVGNADILLEELENTGLERRVEKLSNAAHRCVRIVRSFLSLAREEPLELVPLAPATVIDTALDVVRAEADDADIRILRGPASDQVQIIADEVQLIQVIINLLTNAVHAIRDSGIGNRVTIESKRTGNSLRIMVADNGPGIDPEIRTRIFDPLFTTKAVGKGTGVGLAYCMRTVTAHNGLISLEGTGVGGACFTIELPLAEQA